MNKLLLPNYRSNYASDHEYKAGEKVVVPQSVHRLTLLVPVEYDQEELEADK